MTEPSTDYEMVEGMLAVESPQRVAARILELLERGERELVRELLRARAARISEAIDRELSSLEPL
jgi:hypothetical protein